MSSEHDIVVGRCRGRNRSVERVKSRVVCNWAVRQQLHGVRKETGVLLQGGKLLQKGNLNRKVYDLSQNCFCFTHCTPVPSKHDQKNYTLESTATKKGG